MHVPLSLKMSATWGNEKLSSSIVPRICNLSITQVVFDRLLEDITDGTNYSFFVSIRMRDNTRRVLRSPELTFPNIVPGIVNLDFNCSIQYSHALKRDACNYLQLLIQRRKKYKKKSVNLGYKTIAYCAIDLGQVLQRKIENKFLDLYDDAKSLVNVIGRVEIKFLSTIAAEKDLVLDRRKDVFDEEDEGVHDQFSEPDYSDHGEDSEYDQNCTEFGESSSRQKKRDEVNGRRVRRRSSSPSTGFPEWQKQIKQKVMGLLKKVKLMEHNEHIDPHDTSKIWEEIEQLGNVSDDSDNGDFDSTSIKSIPRPILRPYFSQLLIPNTAGVPCLTDTVAKDTGAKLLKKLQLDNSGTNPYAFSNCNFVEVTSTDETLRHNDGSETTEDESKFIMVAKKTGGTQDKDSTIQRSSSKNKSKSSKPPIPNSFTNPNKKEPPKPKKQISGLMKTFSFTTGTPTAASPTVTNPSKGVLLDSNTLSVTSDTSNSTGTTTLTTVGVSSNTVNSHGFTESAKENAVSDSKSQIDGNWIITNEYQRQRSASIPHSLNKHRSHNASVSDRDFTLVKVLKYQINEKLSSEPRSELMEQVDQCLHSPADCCDIIYIINLSDYGGKYVAEMFTKEHVNHIAVTCFADTKFAMTQIINKVRKRSDNTNKICLLGSDCHLNNILRVFVDQININYSKEIVNDFRFFLIPITGFSSSSFVNKCNQAGIQGNIVFNNMARRICSVDPTYASLFSEFMLVENVALPNSMIERNNRFLFRVHDYLQADGTLHCPIGDCLIACSVKPRNPAQDCESSTESFIPFLCEVRLGESSAFQLNKADIGSDDQWSVNTSSSPPRSPVFGNFDYPVKISISPTSPGMANISHSVPLANSPVTIASSLSNNSSPLNLSPPPDVLSSLDLQLEYWTEHSNKKVTLKSSFRQVLVSPTMVTTSGCNSQHSLLLTIISKEKKQKIIRITKKTKHENSDSKKEIFDDVSRILCTSKSQNSSIRVTIDGVVWTAVKFFQLNPYWRTQIKTFPIATFNNIL